MKNSWLKDILKQSNSKDFYKNYPDLESFIMKTGGYAPMKDVVYASGGYVPHYMMFDDGGPTYKPTDQGPDAEMERPEGDNNTPNPQPTDPAATGVGPQDSEAAWREGQSDQQANDQLTGDNPEEAPAGSAKPDVKPNGWQMGMNLIGAGLAAGNFYNSMRQQRYNDENQRILGSTSSKYAVQTGANSKGDFQQNTGAFRPNQMVPYPMAEYGGMVPLPEAPVKKYKTGGVYQVDSKELARLKQLGYSWDEI